MYYVSEKYMKKKARKATKKKIVHKRKQLFSKKEK